MYVHACTSTASANFLPDNFWWITARLKRPPAKGCFFNCAYSWVAHIDYRRWREDSRKDRSGAETMGSLEKILRKKRSSVKQTELSSQKTKSSGSGHWSMAASTASSRQVLWRDMAFQVHPSPYSCYQ